MTVLGCLREKKDELTPDCKAEVFERQAGAADDWRTDVELFKVCEVCPLPVSTANHTQQVKALVMALSCVSKTSC